MIRLEYDHTTQHADLDQSDGRITEDDGLETSVLISLFSDRRADPGDGADEGDLRGWWADAYQDVEGDRIGSKLWLLLRGKLTQDTLRKTIRYVEEALAWMVEDGVASSVKATADWLQDGTHKIGVLLTTEIQKPGEVAPRWKRTWEVYLGV